MRNTLISLVSFSATTVAAQPQPSVDVCKLMSVEEMQVCSSTRPGDASGARSVYCDQLSAERIAQCVEQAKAGETGSASAGGTAAAPARAPQRPDPKAEEQALPEKK